jgi:hypothetical protein
MGDFIGLDTFYRLGPEKKNFWIACSRMELGRRLSANVYRDSTTKSPP